MRISFLLLILLLVGGNAKATHLRSGYISLKLESGLTYTVSLKIYTNTGSEIRFGNGVLNFGDGSTPIKTPTTENTQTPYQNVGTVTYSVTHIFPKEGAYVISYSEPNLNEGIANVSNSVETQFYIESGVTLVSGRDSSSPEFLVSQFFEQSAGNEFSLSNEAVDQNDYRLTYNLAIPLSPTALSFPSGRVSYTQPPGFSVNYYNGLASWDPTTQGQYLFAVQVNQYDHFGNRVGYVTRTFLVRVADIASDLSTTTAALDVNRKVFVEVNKQRTIRAIVSDNSLSTEVKWDVFFDNRIALNVTFSQHDSTAGSSKMKVGLITLKSTPEIVRGNAYSITLRGTSMSSGTAYSKDISYLFFTRDIELPEITTGMDDSPEPGSRVYPNPFFDYLFVDTPSTINEYDYHLMDIAGKVILDERGVTGKQVDVSTLPAGFYIFQVKSGIVTEQHKLIKR